MPFDHCWFNKVFEEPELPDFPGDYGDSLLNSRIS
jgi:hypothetical protein